MSLKINNQTFSHHAFVTADNLTKVLYIKEGLPGSPSVYSQVRTSTFCSSPADWNSDTRRILLYNSKISIVI